MSGQPGWRLFAHPVFLRQIGVLQASVLRSQSTQPDVWHLKADTKLLTQLREVTLRRIPRGPLGAEFRQGNTLGKANRHWFRAKFGGNRFRVFFRADSGSRIIVFGWVNDRDTLRKAGSSSDPYAVFAGMLAGGNPPSEWSALLAAARPLDFPAIK